MADERSKHEIRLVFQGSIPFDTDEHAESWYMMLKEMVASQSPRATLNGQIIKMLEPCCGDKKGVLYGPHGPQIAQR